MPYNKSDFIRSLSGHKFMKLEDFNTLVHSWTHFRFSDSDSRQKIFADYRDRKIVSWTNSRFPSEGLYIDTDHPFIASRILFLFSVVDYPTAPPTSTAIAINDHDRIIEAREDFKIALQNFYNITGGLTVYHSAPFGIYNRRSFEAYFNLSWS